MHLSPLAQRLLNLLTGTANDPTYWPDASRLSVGFVGLGGSPIPDGDGIPVSVRYALGEPARQVLVAPARELVGRLLEDGRRSDDPVMVVVAAGLAGMDAEVRARFAGERGPIAVAELDVLLGWDVERRSLFWEAVRPDGPPPPGLADWLGGLPGYPEFARTALETAAARVAAIQAGEIPYEAEKAFGSGEKAAIGRAVRLALMRDEPWLPGLLDTLVRGVAVAPTGAGTLPSQAVLFEIARAAEEHPTPEVVSALRAAGRATRHAGVPRQLARMLKRVEPALADRLEVAFRLPDGPVLQAVGEHTAVISADDEVELSWWHGDRKLKTVPVAVTREHPEEVGRLRELVKRTRQQRATLVRALEAGCAGTSAPPYRLLEGHPITDRLIWEFEVSPGVWRAELGLTVPDVPVRLWHPARARAEEVRAWREVVRGEELRQPFKQAFREVYLITSAEEASGVSSHRFAEQVVRYRRLRALFKERGWTSAFLGAWDGAELDGDARRVMAGGRWRARLSHHLYDEDHAITGEVGFDRLVEGGWRAAPLTDVPAPVFSEAMRDVDLFVAASGPSITARLQA
ncbi:DUF4132 domain-containing protein [Nonomuraea harbinensis]|uniref:DUF4132 domain-containing protein n=1 Tax=Nonomuraea harbinensis TaxID=1286938 RepID=A0ABW1C1B3_9ACTN|nr:DUF4132 domain-containing protein [Nonomuraea harbinensis]